MVMVALLGLEPVDTMLTYTGTVMLRVNRPQDVKSERSHNKKFPPLCLVVKVPLH